MIQVQTILKVADNSGVKKVMCIKVLGGSKRRYAYVGDIIVCSVKEIIPTSKISKGSVVKGVVVRTSKEIRRKDGCCLRFDENSIVLIGKNKEPLGTRIFGSVVKELKDKKFTKIVSLATEIL